MPRTIAKARKSPLTLDQSLRALADLDQPIAKIPLDALSDLRPAELERFQSTWMSLPSPRQHAVVTALIDFAEQHIEANFSRLFRWLLGDQDPWVRAQAIQGLWEDEDVLYIAPLMHILQSDPVSEVQATAASSLGRYMLLGELGEIEPRQAEQVRQALLTAFDAARDNPEVRRRILESLAYSAEPPVPDLIRAAYQDEDDALRVSAVFAMGRNADATWRNPVLAELASSDNAMRFEAVRASGELELADAVPELIAMLDEDDIELREAAIWALGRIGGPAARRALQACCASDDPELSEAAQEALDELEFMAGEDDMPGFLFDLQT